MAKNRKNLGEDDYSNMFSPKKPLSKPIIEDEGSRQDELNYMWVDGAQEMAYPMINSAYYYINNYTVKSVDDLVKLMHEDPVKIGNTYTPDDSLTKPKIRAGNMIGAIKKRGLKTPQFDYEKALIEGKMLIDKMYDSGLIYFDGDKFVTNPAVKNPPSLDFLQRIAEENKANYNLYLWED